jgi:hypothetical protein
LAATQDPEFDAEAGISEVGRTVAMDDPAEPEPHLLCKEVYRTRCGAVAAGEQDRVRLPGVERKQKTCDALEIRPVPGSDDGDLLRHAAGSRLR